MTPEELQAIRALLDAVDDDRPTMEQQWSSGAWGVWQHKGADYARALLAEVERLTHLHALDHSLADQWQAKNERLRGLLARLEWAGNVIYDGSDCCPACAAVPHYGETHAPDCWLAAELPSQDDEPDPQRHRPERA